MAVHKIANPITHADKAEYNSSFENNGFVENFLNAYFIRRSWINDVNLHETILYIILLVANEYIAIIQRKIYPVCLFA